MRTMYFRNNGVDTYDSGEPLSWTSESRSPAESSADESVPGYGFGGGSGKGTDR